ncbi:hypothetical protein BJV74DRAFT_208897 [Russula compacta]|nr:hypothetical protein BJV74DRAFT_208897 [Russula compacta]
MRGRWPGCDVTLHTVVIRLNFIWDFALSALRSAWDMGFKRFMGYGTKSPAYQVGNSQIVWDIRVYGF